VEKASVYADAEREALRFKWIESEKAGRDLGEIAIRWWCMRHWWDYLRSRWLEHLQGKHFWIELDRGDFGLLQREFRDHALLLDRILDRLMAGQQNLDIVLWAVDWGIPLEPAMQILTALDVNSRRLASLADCLDSPRVPFDPVWLAWGGGVIPRLARGIAAEGAYDALPILGDALEEAGCSDRTILDHCRAGGRHTRWSWLVALILARS
jgi:hypothetical protein